MLIEPLEGRLLLSGDGSGFSSTDLGPLLSNTFTGAVASVEAAGVTASLDEVEELSFSPILPLSSHVYQAAGYQPINSATRAGEWSINLDEGQYFFVQVSPSSSLRVGIDILDPEGDVLTSLQADANGQAIHPDRVDTVESGDYRVRVTTLNNNDGFINLRVLLNAGYEHEPITGVDNATLSDAESLNALSLDIGGGAVLASVFGSLESGSSVVHQSEDFETGVAGPLWAQLALRIRDDIYAARGDWAMFQWNPNSHVGPSRHVSDWRVDLSDLDRPMLRFGYGAKNDGGEAFDGPFSISTDADGIAMSPDDGLTWYPIWNAPYREIAAWSYHAIDLEAAANAHGLALDAVTMIRFQQYGGGNYGQDPPRSWMGWDELSIVEPGVIDTYVVELAAGQSFSAALSSVNDLPLNMRLLDAGGNLITIDTPGEGGYDLQIADFQADVSGPYYLQIRGFDLAQYHLVTTTDATIVADGFDSSDMAKPLPAQRAAVGTVGASFDRLFSYANENDEHELVELDLANGSVLQRIAAPGTSVEGLGNSPIHLYAVSEADQRVYVVDPDTGQEVNQFPLATPMTLIQDVAYHLDELFVATFTRIYVLDAQSGELKRELSVQAAQTLIGTPQGLTTFSGPEALTRINWGDGKVIERQPSASIRPSNPSFISDFALVGNELFVSYRSAYRPDDSIRVLDARTLELKRLIEVDDLPHELSGDGGFSEDWFSIAASAGDGLTLETSTLASGPRGFNNPLDPALELYDPQGNRVAFDEDGSAGTNARIAHTAGVTGDYLARAFSTTTAGPYVLNVTGQTGDPTPSFEVISAMRPLPGDIAQLAGVLDVHFSAPIDLRTLQSDDLTVGGNPAVAFYTLGGQTVRFELPSLLAGEQELRIEQGAVLGLSGQPVAAFADVLPASGTFEPARDVGFGVVEQPLTGQIIADGVARFRLDIEPGRSVAVAIQPEGSLQPRLRLNAPGVLQEVVASAPGEGIVLDPIRIEQGGSIFFEFDGVSNTTGSFMGTVLIDAALEHEPVGAENDSLTQAQDISDVFVPLEGSATQALVRGTVVNNDKSDDFERLVLGPAWETYRSRVGVVDIVDIHRGEGGDGRFLRMDGDGIMEATWSVDLSGLGHPVLSFWTRNDSDANEPFDGPFTDHFSADGIAISVDGVNWYPAWTPDDRAQLADWTFHAVDLGAAAQAAGVTLGETAKIRLQTYVAGADRTRLWDQLRLTDLAEIDTYKLDLAAGERLDLVASPDGSGQVTAVILDPTGQVITQSQSDAQGAARIDDWIVSDPGTYYVQISAASFAEAYTLVLTREAAIDREWNNTFAQAQALPDSGIAIGRVGDGNDRLFKIRGSGSSIYLDEIDPATDDLINRVLVDGIDSSSALATTPGTVLVAEGRGERWIYEFDMDTFAEVRRFERPFSSRTLPGMAFLEDTVYVIPDRREIAILDYVTGDHLRTIPIARQLQGLTATSDALLGISDNTVYEVDTQTGELTALVTLDSASGPLAIVDKSFIALYPAGTSDEYAVYDLQTWELKSTVRLRGNMIGADEGIIDDLYSFQADAGSQITLSTRTPGDEFTNFSNQLDPALELYDASGMLIAEDQNSGADGRNALLAHTIDESGAYIVRVKAESLSRGEYILSVSGLTDQPEAPFTAIAVDPIDDAFLETRPTHLTVNFNDFPDFTTIDATDLTVNGIAAADVTIVDSDTVVFNLPAIFNGVHTVEIAQGAIADIQGTPVDALVSSFTVGQFPLTIPLNPIEPLGGTVYEGTVTGVIDPVGDSNVYHVDLDQGQTLTLMLRPRDLLRASAVLVGPDGVTPIASALADSAGHSAVIQSAPIVQPGRYQIVVSGVDQTTGGFELTAMLNAIGEAEWLLGQDNGSPQNAQPIDAAAIALAETSDRVVLRGSLSGGYVNFDSGELDDRWQINNQTEIRSSSIWGSGNAAYEGLALYQYGFDGTPLVIDEATWSVDLTGLTEPRLEFWHGDWDFETPFEGPFEGHYEADGVAVSADGTNWYPIWSAVDQEMRWEKYVVDLEDILATTGLDTRDELFLRFQRVGEGRGSRGWDEVSLVGVQADVDWYRLSLEAGQLTDFVLAADAGPDIAAQVVVEVFDGAGRRLAKSADVADNVESVIRNFAAETTAEYHVRVSGTGGTAYTLMVTRGASFDLEANDGMSAAQALASGVAVGHLHRGADPISTDVEPNDAGADLDIREHLLRAADLSGSFEPIGNDQYLATLQGQVGGDDLRDVYRILAKPGDELRVIQAGLSSNYNMQFYNENGEQIANGSSQLTYDEFACTGVYYISVHKWSGAADTYNLSVELTTEQISGDRNDDWYAISADEGASLTLRTLTPGGGPGEFNSTVDPAIALYDAAGVLVGLDDNSAADGRNANLQVVAPYDGTYFIHLSTATGTSGEYVLEVTGANQQQFALPIEFSSGDPVVSLTHHGQAQDVIYAVGQSIGFALDLHGGQAISLAATGTLGLTPVLDLFEPDGRLLVSQRATSPDGTAWIRTQPLAQTGRYIVRVRGAGDTVGSFSISATLNAAIEIEPLTGRPNDSKDHAQSLGSSFIALGGISVQSRRGAVIGSIDPADASTSLFENFETGELGADWSTYQPDGRVVVGTSSGLKFEGEYQLRMWDGRVEAEFAVDLSAYDAPALYFHMWDNTSSDRPFTSDPFVGHVFADGIAASPDGGVTWYPVWSPIPGSDDEWQPHVADLHHVESHYGVDFGADTRIRLQAFDSTRYWDAIHLAEAPADWYSVSLEAGQSIAYQVTSEGEGGATVALIDPTGNELQTVTVDGQGNPDVTSNTLIASVDGVYHLRVQGHAISYKIVVQKDLAFEAEPHNDQSPAQGVANPVLGQLDGMTDVDQYSVTLDGGSPFTLELRAPADGTLVADHQTHLRAEILKPDGEVLLTHQVSLSANDRFTVNIETRQAGEYIVRLTPIEDHRNVYIIELTDHDPSTVPLEILSVRPLSGSVLTEIPGQARIVFSHAVDESTLDPADLNIDGVPATAFTVENLYTVVFDLPHMRDGEHTLTVPAGGISHVHGQTNVEASWSFLFDAPPLRVIDSTIWNDARLTDAPDEISITLSQPVNTESLQPSDLFIAGMTATSVQAISGTELVFELPPDLAEGVHTVMVAAGAFEDIYGQPVEPFSISFTYGKAPRVIASSILPGDVIPIEGFTYTASFDRPLAPQLLDASDVQIIGASQTHIPYALTYDADRMEVTAMFDPLSEGAYTLRLRSATFAFMSDLGFILDGEVHAQSVDGLPTGDGLPGGDLTLNFSADVQTSPIPSDFVDVSPAGFDVLETRFQGVITPQGDIDRFTLNLSEGELIAAHITPTENLELRLRVLGPTGVMATVDAAGAGQPLTLSAVVAPTGGPYVLEVIGLGETTGTYEVHLVRNAAMEQESRLATDNDALIDAEDASHWRIDHPFGRRTWAILGELPDPSGIPIFTSNFEAGVLGDDWSIYTEDEYGRIMVSDQRGAAGGTYALLMDRTFAETKLNEAIWTVDLTGIDQPHLAFSSRSFGDEAHAFSGPFVGHFNADGVAISADGDTWYPVAPPNYGLVWRETVVDLAALAADLGLTLGENVKIKFQQYDNLSLGADGLGYDEIAIREPIETVDSYRVPFSAGAVVSLALIERSGDDGVVRLYDSAGSKLLESESATPAGIPTIEPFEIASEGWYVVTVSGAVTDYMLTITEHVGTLPGDFDGNGAFDAFDVDDFELALADPDEYLRIHPGVDLLNIGDMDGSGVFDAFDVDEFERALTDPDEYTGTHFGIDLIDVSDIDGDGNFPAAPADFSGDAVLDPVTANGGTDAISVFLNQLPFLHQSAVTPVQSSEQQRAVPIPYEVDALMRHRSRAPVTPRSIITVDLLLDDLDAPTRPAWMAWVGEGTKPQAFGRSILV